MNVCTYTHTMKNWYELQLQMINQWLEGRPEYSLHSTQTQSTETLTKVCVHGCIVYICIVCMHRKIMGYLVGNIARGTLDSHMYIAWVYISHISTVVSICVLKCRKCMLSLYLRSFMMGSLAMMCLSSNSTQSPSWLSKTESEKKLHMLIFSLP